LGGGAWDKGSEILPCSEKIVTPTFSTRPRKVVWEKKRIPVRREAKGGKENTTEKDGNGKRR